MRPTLFEIFGLKFHSYVTLMSLAFLVGTFGIVKDARRQGIMGGSTRGGFWGFLGALLGAKIWWILQYDKPINLWRAVIIWEGGMVFYGGLIGGLVAVLIYLRVLKLPVRLAADLAAPYVALGEALGRLGCFLNGCCWGLPTSVPWAVCFPRGSHPFKEQVKQGLLDATAQTSLPIHPTQLYSLVGLVLIFFALKALQEKRLLRGTVFLAYLGFYGLLRFSVELFREGPRPVWSMTLSQIISLISLGIGAGLFFFFNAHSRQKGAGVEPGDPETLIDKSA